MTRKSLLRQALLKAGLLAAITLTATASDAAVILDDTFDYANSAALQAAWNTATGSASEFSSTFALQASGSGWISSDAAARPSDVTGQTLLKMNSGRSTYRALGSTLDAVNYTDIKVTAYFAMTAYSRSTQVALLNDAGQGYAINWNASLPSNNDAHGVLTVYKVTAWTGNTNGSSLSPTNTKGLVTPIGYDLPHPYGSNPNPLDFTNASPFAGFSKIEFTWDAATGTMKIYHNGADIGGTWTDVSYNAFTRLYLGGTAGVYFDQVIVEATPVPEPASLGLLALGGLMMLRRRRN